MISFKKKTLLSVAVAVMLGSAQLPGTSWAAQAPAAVVQEVSAGAQAPAVVKNPPKLALKIDRADVNQLPRNFRMGSDKYVGVTKTGIMPTRKGMDTMNVSASSCFSEKELEAILKKVPVKPSQFYDVDLRGESHGYLNGTAVSWFANHDWGNDGRTEDIIIPLEKEQLASLKDSTVKSIYRFDDKKNVLLSPIYVNYNKVRTEEKMVKQHGVNYFRLTLQDHFRPDDPDVDKFLEFYKSLPKDAWLHYHCYAGMGRTTIFMVMHDILKNAKDVSFDDIIQRQKLIGIVDLSEIPDKKKNYGRKAYIERYQFVQHFYDYVKENPDLKTPYSVWAKKNKVNSWEPDYNGYIWRLDTKDRNQLPRNFRTMNSAFRTDVNVKKTGKGFTPTPTRKGLDTLYMSGSAEFSNGELQAMLPVLKQQAKGPIYIMDLRQETHGVFNGNAVSWYGLRDWGNLGKNKAEVLKDENSRLNAARGKSLIVAALDKNKMPIDPKPVKIESVMTEQQLVEKNGLHYYRIAATDHIWPSAANIDEFINFTRTLPANAWLHFHCQAGAGRTTAYMAMYDMMKNPDVSLGDILSRQYLLGGNYVAYEIAKPKPDQWKADYYHQKAHMVEKFYQYVQENHANGFKTSWSQWLAAHQDV